MNDQKIKRNTFLKKMIKLIIYSVVLCFTSIALTLIMSRQGTTKTIHPRHYGMEENPYLSFRDANPHFDRNIAIGPEISTSRFSVYLIVHSNLLKDSDKEILTSYESEMIEKYPSHKVQFQVCFGIKDDKDYIWLIDNYYDERKGEKVTTFLFESNLPYTFLSLADDYKTLTGKELPDSSFMIFDHQHTLSRGLALCFIEIKYDFYQEYYIAKTSDRRVFIINKYNQIDE